MFFYQIFQDFFLVNIGEKKHVLLQKPASLPGVRTDTQALHWSDQFGNQFDPVMSGLLFKTLKDGKCNEFCGREFWQICLHGRKSTTNPPIRFQVLFHPRP
jgi:hypothetical protein